MQLPLFETTSTWTLPTGLPELKNSSEIAIDTENCDPTLKTWGTGSVIGSGFVAGVSVAARSLLGVTKLYLPIKHFGGDNLDGLRVTQYLKDICSRPDVNYIFMNAGYDLLWLRTLGIEVAGTITDIGVMEALLDEENPAGYGLDAIAWRRTGRRKDESLLRKAASDYGLADPKADMWKLPARHVGPYSETDAELTLLAWEAQKLEIEKQNLWQVVRLEQQVTPILADMHWKGLPVNLPYAEELNERWRKDEVTLMRSLNLSYDDIWNSEALAKIARAEGLVPLKTEKTGKDSITKDWLAEQAARGNKRMGEILKCRAINKCRSDYLEGNLIKGVRNGKIFPEYVQLAMEDDFDGFNGTRSGRLACKNPNAQQFPKRSRLFDAKALRYALVPEGLWSKGDYWSQEPVFQCHYGLLLNMEGSWQVRKKFADGVKLYTFIEEATRGACTYDQAKEVVLGRSYGMGAKKMSKRMSIPLERCYEILEAFDNVVPYIKKLADYSASLAKKRGYIKTICGRRRHFNKWTVQTTREERTQGVKFRAWGTIEQALAEYDDWHRQSHPGTPVDARQCEHAFAYKAFNALIQGSSADQTKTALVHMKQAGIHPRMTVHDEISAFASSEKEHQLHKEIMENCINLLAPVRADMSLGSHWQ